ncbi:TPA: hypothetical protein ACHOZC_003412 [Raoultella ornithinolytica]
MMARLFTVIAFLPTVAFADTQICHDEARQKYKEDFVGYTVVQKDLFDEATVEQVINKALQTTPQYSQTHDDSAMVAYTYIPDNFAKNYTVKFTYVFMKRPDIKKGNCVLLSASVKSEIDMSWLNTQTK